MRALRASPLFANDAGAGEEVGVAGELAVELAEHRPAAAELVFEAGGDQRAVGRGLGGVDGVGRGGALIKPLCRRGGERVERVEPGAELAALGGRGLRVVAQRKLRG